MSEQGTENQQAPRPVLEAMTQYVKDMSFENPGAPAALTARPQIDMGVDLQARRVEGDMFEVELKLRINAANEGKPLFLLELAYAGLFRLQNMPEEMLQPILLVQAPHMLFPFARRIVADVVRDGGMPPLMIEPIDFMTLYRAKMEGGGITQTTQPAGNA